jgi:putative flippase GtrA
MTKNREGWWERGKCHHVLVTARFLTVSIGNTVLGIALFWMLLDYFGPVEANLLSYSAGIAAGFFLNRSWTFRGKQGSAVKYVAVYLSGLGLSTTFVGIASLVMPALIAKVLSCPVSFVWTYGMSRVWAFAR